jgi:hypothetical protein
MDRAMTRLSLEIELSVTLARQATEAGLLESDAVELMVREALLARRVESLAEAREVRRRCLVHRQRGLSDRLIERVVKHSGIR